MSWPVRVLIVAISVIVAVFVVWFAIGPGPMVIGGVQISDISDAADRATALSGIRQSLLTALGGLVATASITVAAVTYRLNARGQLAERVSTAIGDLASSSLLKRLGAIHATDAIMRDSLKDHDAMINVLSAAIARWAPAANIPTNDPIPDAPLTRLTYANFAHPPADVQAALTALSRRPKRGELDPVILNGTDLRGASLKCANFRSAYLSRVALSGAYLRYATLDYAVMNDANLRGIRLNDSTMQHAVLTRSDLRNADLGRANLTFAHLDEAQLDGADLRGASLRGADARNVSFAGARFEGAVLRGAKLYGADLSTAIGITRSQIDGAETNNATKLPKLLS